MTSHVNRERTSESCRTHPSRNDGRSAAYWFDNRDARAGATKQRQHRADTVVAEQSTAHASPLLA